MSDTTLIIKDGTGASSGLSAVSSSTGYSTYHALTGANVQEIITRLGNINPISSSVYSISSSVYTINSNINNYTIAATTASITTASAADLSSVVTVGALSGRKTLIFFNHTNADVYMSIGATIDVPNGIYTYVISSSGSYLSEHRYAELAHYLTGSSGLTTGRVTITSIRKP
jgi:hypothetical protein